MPPSGDPHSHYAVAAIRHFDSINVFCDLRRLEQGEDPAAPYVLAIDEATEAALEQQAGAHLLSSNHKPDGVVLVGILVGRGHSAVLSAVEPDGSLRRLRDVDTGILYIEVAGPDAPPPDARPAYTDSTRVIAYKPSEAAALHRRVWWRFWQRN